MKEVVKIEADVNNLPTVLNKLETVLALADVSFPLINKVSLVVEEIFTNIAMYAYSPKKGEAEIQFDIENEELTITFIDEGKAYNPLETEDPDLTLDAKSRGIGGLGIFISKNIADSMDYARDGNKNILTIKKSIN